MFDFEKQLSALSKQTVLCIGDLMLDNFVYGEVSRISPEAPAPVIAVAREDIIVGGAGNVARNIASLGAHCIFVGVVGQDAGGRRLKSELARLESSLAIAEKIIPAGLMADYKRLVQGHGATALAPIENKACTSCMTTVTTQQSIDLRNGKFTFCRNCGRMLYQVE